MQSQFNRLIFVVFVWPYYWVRIHLWWPRRKKSENILADMGKMIDLRPDYAPFYVNRASALASKYQNTEQGFADCDKAVQLNPMLGSSPQVYTIRARLHLADNDTDKALEQLDLSLKANPTLRTTYFFRAHLHSYVGNHHPAIADYRQGLKYDFGMDKSQYADIHVKIGQIYLQMDDNQKALDEFEKAAGFSPQNLDMIQGRIHVYASRKDVNAVNVEISKIPPKKTSYLALAIGARGHTYLSQGNLEHALKDFEQALQLQPNHWQLLLNRGQAHLRMGNIDAALKDLQRVAEVNPRNPYGHNAAGYVYLLQGDIEAAKAAIDRAIKLHPTFRAAYDLRGHLRLVEGDYAAALEDFEASVKGYPDESTRISGQAGQAVAHFALDDADTAIAQWRALCERNNDHEILDYLRKEAIWPPKSLELAERLNALVFP